MRWLGHRLIADAELDIDPRQSLAEAHRIAHDAEHALTHAMPKLAEATSTRIRRTPSLRSAAELEPDIVGRGSHRFQAPERLDARVAVPRRRLMRIVRAVQPDLIRTALVVTEFQ